jgi:hypothetical protein
MRLTCHFLEDLPESLLTSKASQHKPGSYHAQLAALK